MHVILLSTVCGLCRAAGNWNFPNNNNNIFFSFAKFWIALGFVHTRNERVYYKIFSLDAYAKNLENPSISAMARAKLLAIPILQLPNHNLLLDISIVGVIYFLSF